MPIMLTSKRKGTRERHLESIIHATLKRIILTRQLPRTLIQLTLQVVSMPDASTYNRSAGLSPISVSLSNHINRFDSTRQFKPEANNTDSASPSLSTPSNHPFPPLFIYPLANCLCNFHTDTPLFISRVRI